MWYGEPQCRKVQWLFDIICSVQPWNENSIRFLVQPNALSDAHGASAVWVNHPALLGKTFHIYYQVYMTYP